MAAVASAVAAMAAIVLVGWALGRRGTLGPAGMPVLVRTCFTVATPSLLLVTVARADLRVVLSRTALVTVLTTSLVAVLALAVLAGLWRRPVEEVVIGTLASSYVNAGNLGLPLAVYLLHAAVAVVPPLLFQLLVLAPIAFSVLDARASTGGTGPRATVGRVLRNPIIGASLSGLVLAALPWHLPDGVLAPFALIGAAAAPLALLTFGMSIATGGAAVGSMWSRELVLAVVLRSLASPAVALALGTVVGLGHGQLLAVVTMAALPTAQNVLVYASAYGHGQRLAQDAGLVTTVLAVPVLLAVAAVLR